MAESRPVAWRLAPGYLAAGKVNLLVGAEGIGKSLWAIRATTSVTTGKSWGPFTISSDPADAILIATEDGWEDTIRPRLEVARADLDRVHVLCADDDGTGTPTFPDDMSALQGRIGITPSLIVVDAWIDTVPGGLQVKDPQKARRAVSPWKDYAAETGAAILLVTHTNRQESQDIRNTYGLSGALRQVARSTMYVVEDPDTKALLVGPDKSNLGAKGVAHRFIKTPVQHFPPTEESDGTVARLDSIGDDSRSIQDLLSEQADAAKPRPKTTAIDLWLSDTLSDGPVPSSDLEAMAMGQGYSPDQLRGAGDRLGVKRTREGKKWTTSL
ncbi:AAA family ATPase [Mycobacterium sp.]|uniref:AAA family ATPase n=1 Tax=Mycobacterium sp. TaxID=1785 RepID=UPI003F9D59AA